MIVRVFCALAVIAALAGCGSMRTLPSESAINVRDGELKGTRCDSIPRIYSGVVYDFCWLLGDSKTAGAGFVGQDGAAVTLPLVDMALSGVTDTLALPYTIFRQRRDGSIELTHGN